MRVRCLRELGGCPILHSLVTSTWASHRHVLSLRCLVGKVGSQLLPPGAVVKTTDPGVGVPAGTVSVSVGSGSL